MSDAELAYMCPHTTTYVSSYSSYYYMSICSVSGVPDAELASPAIIPADLGKYGGYIVVTGQVKKKIEYGGHVVVTGQVIRSLLASLVQKNKY